MLAELAIGVEYYCPLGVKQEGKKGDVERKDQQQLKSSNLPCSRCYDGDIRWESFKRFAGQILILSWPPRATSGVLNISMSKTFGNPCTTCILRNFAGHVKTTEVIKKIRK